MPYQLKGDGTTIMVPADQVARLRMLLAETGPAARRLGRLRDLRQDRRVRHLELRREHQPGARARRRARAHHLVDQPRSSRRASISCCRSARCSRATARRRAPRSSSSCAAPSGSSRAAGRGDPAPRRLGRARASTPNRVSVVDTDGNLLARGDGDGDAAPRHSNRPRRCASITRTACRASSRSLLERSVGPGKARVDVHVDMDFDRITTNSESYDPERPSGALDPDRHRIERQQRRRAAGQPVSVIDQPAQRADRRRASANANRTHELAQRGDRQLRDHQDGRATRCARPATVKRLSVAVLVDGNYAAAKPTARKTYSRARPKR